MTFLDRDHMDTEWKQKARCRGLDPELFFPQKGENSREAQKVCAGCPVRRECAEYGIYERWGVWGGNTEKMRRQARKDPSFSNLRQVQSA